jgi:hypothetical protein
MASMVNIVETPEIFLTKTNHTYPPGNNKVFEQFFLEKFLEETPSTDRIYIPVQWTCFYISRNYCQLPMDDLQNFLDSLPRDKKYFTICQWDDGIKNNLSGLDIIKFSSGGVGDYQIPLINQPHQKERKEKNIFASFIGVIGGRHRIREYLRERYSNVEGYFISESQGFDKFKEIMERSVFSLCPRGYGKTSFRINESLNLGAIPVYIYDEPWIPFEDELDFNEYGVLLHQGQLDDLDNILKSYNQEKINKMLEKGEEVYREYYTYEGCYDKIIKKLKNNG